MVGMARIMHLTEYWTLKSLKHLRPDELYRSSNPLDGVSQRWYSILRWTDATLGGDAGFCVPYCIFPLAFLSGSLDQMVEGDTQIFDCLNALVGRLHSEKMK